MEYRCRRCNHIWVARKEQKPIICPKCKSPYWNQPSTRISKEFVEQYKNQIIKLHDFIINSSGGEKGIRDDGGLYNAACKILNYYLKHYNSKTKVGAFIFEDLAKRHYFMDGNKRTAYGIVKVYLITEGYHLKVDYAEAVSFIIQIARHENPKTFDEIAQWLKQNIKKIPSIDIEIYLKELLYDIIFGEKNEEKI